MSNFKFLDNSLKDVSSNDLLEIISKLPDEYKKYLDDYFNPQSEINKLLETENLAKLVAAFPEDFPKLYHYTNMEALEGIVKSKKLYVKSIHEMNDNKEMSYTFNIAMQILNYYDPTDEEIDEFIETIKLTSLDIYIMCFSANDHSQALQHYGEIALEMDNQKLQELMGEKGAHGKDDLSQLDNDDFYAFPLKVEYNEDRQVKMINLIIQYWLVSRRLYVIDNKFMSTITQECGMALFLLSVAFKSPLLSQEEEVRFVLLNRHAGNEVRYETIFNGNHAMIIPLKNDTLEKIIYSHDSAKEQPNIRKILDNSVFNHVKDEITKLPY